MKPFLTLLLLFGAGPASAAPVRWPDTTCAVPAFPAKKAARYPVPGTSYRNMPGLAGLLPAVDDFYAARIESAKAEGALLDLSRAHCGGMDAYQDAIAAFARAFKIREKETFSVLPKEAEIEYLAKEAVPPSYWKMASYYEEKYGYGDACAALKEPEPVSAPAPKKDAPFGPEDRKALEETALDADKYNDAVRRLRAAFDRMRQLTDGYECREIHRAWDRLSHMNRAAWEERVDSDLARIAGRFVEGYE